MPLTFSDPCFQCREIRHTNYIALVSVPQSIVVHVIVKRLQYILGEESYNKAVRDTDTRQRTQVGPVDMLITV